jgi:hypothetical protein
VAYLFQGGPPPPCEEEGDADNNGSIDVGDQTYLVAFLFQGGPPPPFCFPEQSTLPDSTTPLPDSKKEVTK